jgi:hypothetical protein
LNDRMRERISADEEYDCLTAFLASKS